MEKINVRKCALKYPGAKNRIAGWICGNIPAHDVYLEPFFGSGAVFFNKQPAKIETINDLDDNVVNYFKVIREKSDELISALRRRRIQEKNTIVLLMIWKMIQMWKWRGNLRSNAGWASDAAIYIEMGSGVASKAKARTQQKNGMSFRIGCYLLRSG